MAKEISELSEEELDKLISDETEELPEDNQTEEVPEDNQGETQTEAEEEDSTEEAIPTSQDKEVQEDKNDKAFNGIRRELTQERDRRRQAELQLQALNDRLAKLEKPEKEEDPLGGYEDDDVTPVKELRGTLTKVKELENKIQQQEAYIREREHRERVKHIDDCEAKAREKYSKQSVGEYDYDTVRINGFMPLAQQNPEIFRAVMNSDNPAEEAYKLGISRMVDPYELITKKQAVVKKPAKPMAKTIGNVPASGGALAETDVDSLSDSDIANLSDKELDRLLK